MHHALPVDARLPGEGAGRDLDVEMGLPSFPPAAVTLVFLRVIDDSQMLRGERGC